jgi:hypothetical protein
MAEERARTSRQRGELRAGKPRPTRERTRVTGAQVADRAREQLADITGCEAQGVSELSRDEDGGWTVTVELLELSRVPPSDDLLGSYRAQFDQRGELLGYERLRRYARGRPGGNSQLDGG